MLIQRPLFINDTAYSAAASEVLLAVPSLVADHALHSVHAVVDSVMVRSRLRYYSSVAAHLVGSAEVAQSCR